MDLEEKVQWLRKEPKPIVMSEFGSHPGQFGETATLGDRGIGWAFEMKGFNLS
jgi:hypothetical protein